MKKITQVVLILIIVLLLIVMGVGGYFLVKENNDTKKEIEALKNELTSFKTNDNKIVQKEAQINENIPTEQEAKELGNKMYNLAEEYYKKVSKLHADIVNQEIGNVEKQVKLNDNTTMNLIKSTLINQAYENITEYFNITEKDGEYYISNAGIGSNPRYTKTRELQIKNIEENKITYISTSEYDDIPETKDYEFVIINRDGEWQIEQFTIPY